MMNDDLWDEMLGILSGYDECIKIIYSLKGKWPLYSEWEEGKGIGRKSTIMNTRKDLRDIKDGKIDFSQYHDMRDKAMKRLKGMRDYIDFCNTNAFIFNNYFVYFLYMDKKEPLLGQALLKIEPKANPTHRNVIFKNVPDAKSSNYRGTFQKFQDRVLFISLTSSDNEDRKLHIEATYTKPNQDILLGSYTTFENNSVVRGSLIFKLIKDDESERVDKHAESEHPLLTSFNCNKEAFLKIKRPIKQYLSQRIFNYHKTPEIIPDIDGLKEFIDNYDHNEKSEKRFLEIEKPVLFISSPSTSIDKKEKDKNDKAIHFITNELKKKRPDIDVESLHSRQIKTLERLRRTRYFLLILNGINKASFSLVQLGWALSFCKKVVLYYRQGTISSGLRDIDNLNKLHDLILTRNYPEHLSLDDAKHEIIEFMEGIIIDDIGEIDAP